MMEEAFSRSVFGTGGFLASVGLADINGFMSLLVGLTTLCYMSFSIYKLWKDDS